MIKSLDEFVNRFETNVRFDETLVVNQQGRFFLLDETIKRLVRKNFYYAGVYLGEVKDGDFVPSFNLLNMIAKKKANTINLKKKAEWLFICGRDVFVQGIVKAEGSKKKGDYVLVVNSYGECLGFGKIVHDLDGKGKGPAVENILDVGDFLRRER
jgi:ribosome biogenesis protein Nip4